MIGQPETLVIRKQNTLHQEMKQYANQVKDISLHYLKDEIRDWIKVKGFIPLCLVGET